MHPVLVDLGFFQLPTYGVMLVIAVIVGLVTLRRRANRAGLPGDRLVDLALWVVLWGLLGGKLMLVAVEWRRFAAHPAELVSVLRAGGVFLGGLLAGLVAFVVLLRRYRLPLLPTADAVVPSVALGHAIGRVGCLMAGCCWGARCDLPWAIVYTDPRAHANVGTPLGVPLHPFPVYAMLANLIIWAVLERTFAREHRAGRVLAWYLTLYPVARFLLEFTRGDAARGFVIPGVLSTSQAISLVLLAAGIGLHLRISRSGP